MNGEEEIKTALAKLKKDELYTFITGFGIGLVYFLALVTNSKPACPLSFCIENNYYITLFLLVSWLLSTLFVYLVYHLICWPAYCRSTKKAKEFLDNNPQQVEKMNYKSYEDYLASYPHLFGLICAALLLLAPVPYLLKNLHNIFQIIIWPILMGVGLILAAALFYKYALWPHLKDVALTNEKINRRLIVFE